MASILVIEDEPELSGLITEHLCALGHQVMQAFTGTDGLAAFDAGEFDVIVLDVMLPGIDGLTLCRTIRARSVVPIIMLTARSEEIDRVLGLELGADDYVAKPFSMRELVARVRAQLRRQEYLPPPPVPGISLDADAGVLRQHDCTLHPQTRVVMVAGQAVDLTRREFDLLAYFMTNPARVVTREWLLERVWGDGFDGFDRTVDTHMLRLRDKLGRDSRIAHALTAVRGIGYKLEP